MIYFDWDAENLAHIAMHDVTAAEVEYVLTHPTVDLGFQDWHDEELFSEAGPTAADRFLLVVTTMRGSKTRVVTAYDAPAFAIRAYLYN